MYGAATGRAARRSVSAAMHYFDTVSYFITATAVGAAPEARVPPGQTDGRRRGSCGKRDDAVGHRQDELLGETWKAVFTDTKATKNGGTRMITTLITKS